MPKAQEAWSRNSEDFDDEKVDKKTAERENRDGKKTRSNYKNRSHSASSDSESDAKEFLRGNRIKSSKSRERQFSKDKRQRSLKSSGSFSNNSDITDVSPLGSNENSPRFPRRSNKNNKHNGQYDDVQYDSNSPERPADIKLETEEIDLSILMKCMADIDREKQERLKANTRRVMFAPPAVNENRKGNYTFSASRAKTIEKENQRLLKQIMVQMHTGSGRRPEENKPKAPRRPKKATEPVVQRLTPSAVNRIREQRRIESENMHILNRLHNVKPSQGMSKHEQLAEFERQMSYGIPSGTVIIHDRDRSSRAYSVMSQTSTQRSRPSSAKSQTSTTVGKRSRPSSAKSNASVMSNASLRSNASKRSTMSLRSNFSTASLRRTSDGRADSRPPWDDRFSYS